jgi:hypothetical protein
MRRSLLMRLAWRQSLLRLALLYSVAILVGWWSGYMAWSLLAATAAVAGARLLAPAAHPALPGLARSSCARCTARACGRRSDTLVYRRQTGDALQAPGAWSACCAPTAGGDGDAGRRARPRPPRRTF